MTTNYKRIYISRKRKGFKALQIDTFNYGEESSSPVHSMST